MKLVRVVVLFLFGVVLLDGLACNDGEKATIAPDTVVAFSDSNLETAVREAINISNGDIYHSDLIGLTSLDAYYLDITNLSGLEHCTSLLKLDLSGNNISDISALSGLTNLWYLDLGSNH